MRADGQAELLEQGRAAQKRILKAKAEGREASEEDKKLRNQAKKARKQQKAQMGEGVGMHGPVSEG